MAEENKTPIKLAFVIDGEVVDVLHTDERLAAIFTSNPLVLDVSERFVEDPLSVSSGAKYNYETGEFTEPEAL
jgi:hypothetical protein